VAGGAMGIAHFAWFVTWDVRAKMSAGLSTEIDLKFVRVFEEICRLD
jgi:hypothetical protein